MYFTYNVYNTRKHSVIRVGSSKEASEFFVFFTKRNIDLA